ncbi:MAG: cytidylate kinase family protein, partial [Lachnospiraceae bacterium]|nr:cytidylate kinase family protein [Lachnospiraceae bacterium]
MNQKITVAINREYGSGGKNIGMMLSENLGIPYYDKDILKLAADESGINEALFRKHDEDADTGLFKIDGPIYRAELLTPDIRDLTS